MNIKKWLVEVEALKIDHENGDGHGKDCPALMYDRPCKCRADKHNALVDRVIDYIKDKEK